MQDKLGKSFTGLICRGIANTFEGIDLTGGGAGYELIGGQWCCRVPRRLCAGITARSWLQLARSQAVRSFWDDMAAPGPPAESSGPSMAHSFLQARCQEPIMTTDWGLPLFIALVLLGLLYAFLYLPATVHRALLQEALANQTAAATRGQGD
ncbi:hypothetical protein SKAU_G00291340 [Synaphobranchus kaupii]|uniref:Uncharacterized protein n=1 Tax=Synaphobranchus kaupii TaxID=118154 RepID=A0A9Q1ETT7_SYNKA|nr:hypothetical protein SKAU_G00291340 [Synaphobranchus kaupii]